MAVLQILSVFWIGLGGCLGSEMTFDTLLGRLILTILPAGDLNEVSTVGYSPLLPTPPGDPESDQPMYYSPTIFPLPIYYFPA